MTTTGEFTPIPIEPKNQTDTQTELENQGVPQYSNDDLPYEQQVGSDEFMDNLDAGGDSTTYTDPVAKASASFLSPKGNGLMTDEEASSLVQPVKDSAKDITFKNIINNPALSPKAKYNFLISSDTKAHDGANTVVGMVHHLASQGDDPKGLRSYYRDTLSYLDHKERIVKQTQQQLGEFIADEQDRSAIFSAGKAGTVGGYASAFANAAWYGIHGFQSALFTDQDIQLVNITKKYVPGVEISDYATPRELYNSFGRKLKELPTEKAKAVVNEVLQQITEKSGTITTHNGPEAINMAQKLLESTWDEHSVGANVEQIIDLLASVPVAGTVLRYGYKGVKGATLVATDLGSIAAKGVGEGAAGLVAAATKNPLNLSEKALRQVEALNSLDKATLEKGQTISKGTVADAAADTKAGQEKLLDSAVKGEDMSNVNTTPEQVIDDLAMPKLDKNLDSLGRPYLERPYLTPDEEASVKDRIARGLDDRFQNRLKDAQYRTDDTGVTSITRLGSSKGNLYESEEFASNLAKDQFGEKGIPWRVLPIEEDGVKKYAIEIEEHHPIYPQDIKSDKEALSAGWRFRKFFNISAVMGKRFLESASEAVKNSDLAEAHAKLLVKPFHKLPFYRRAKVLKALDYADRKAVDLGIEDIFALGLKNKGEQDAFFSIKKMQRLNYEQKNFNAYHFLKSRGYNELSAVIKQEGDETGQVLKLITKKVENLDGAKGSDVVLDRATGNKLKVRDVRSDSKLSNKIIHKVFKPGEKEPNYVLLTTKELDQVKELPFEILHYRPGTINKLNTFTHYLRDLEAGQMLYGARSVREANLLKEKVIAERTARGEKVNPAKLSIQDSSEIAGEATIGDDLQHLKNEGLLYNDVRHHDMIVGLDGKPRARSTEASINAMVRNIGLNSGIKRWTDAEITRLNKTYADIIDPESPIQAGMVPKYRHVYKSREMKKRVSQLTTKLEHIERMNGIDRGTNLPIIRDIRDVLGDALTESGSYLRLEGTNAPRVFKNVGKVVAGPFTFMGENILGQDRMIEQAVKTLAFVLYLGANPARNVLTQTSAIPTYMAVEGGAKYALSGRFFKDMSTLEMMEVAPEMAERLNPKLVKLYKKTGFDESVQNHILTMGTINDSDVRLGGIMDDTVGFLSRSLQKIGFDWGNRADKRGSFLFGLNRWRVQNGNKWPETERQLAEVLEIGNKLNTYQNRAGVLPTQVGGAGFITQFASYNIKMSGRLMGMEAGFSPAERLRFQLMTLLAYGFDGYRLGAGVDAAAHAALPNDPEKASEIALYMKQGVNGMAANFLLRAIFDDKDEPFIAEDGLEKNGQSAINYSGSVSPYSFIGPYAETLRKAGNWLEGAIPGVDNTTGIFSHVISNAPWYGNSVAGLSAVQGLYEASKFALFLAGNVDMPATDEMKAITARYFRQFPAVSNFMKARVGYTTGIMPDSRGNPSTVVTKGEAVAKAVGINSYSQENQYALTNFLHGPMGGEEEKGVDKELQRLANKNGAMIVEALKEYKGGKATHDDVMKLLYEHAVAYRTALGPEWATDYFKYLVRYYEKKGTTKDKALISHFLYDIKTKRVRTEAPSFERFMESNDFRGKKIVNDYLKDQFDVRDSIKQLLEARPQK